MKTLLAAVTAAVLGLGAAASAWAGAPTDQLKAYTDQVVKVLEDPALKPEDRRASVRRLALEAFDVNETAKRALGRHWQARTPAEREEFASLFVDVLERAYISQVDQYGGERLKYVGEAIDGDTATVRGRVLTRKGSEIPVDARMVRRGDRWLIFDVLVENISMIGNYRAQFDSIITKASYAELVRRLKERQLPPSGDAPATRSRRDS